MKIWTRVFLIAICTIAVSVAGTVLAVAPTGFTSQEYFDTDGDGTVDSVVVVVNGGEALTNCDLTVGTELTTDWTYVGNGIGGSIASATCDMPSATITFVITGANSDTTGADSNQPTITYDDDDGDWSIENASGPLTNTGAISIMDAAKPVYISAEAVSDTVVEVGFSENMSAAVGPPSYLPNPAGFTATGMTVTGATVRVADDTFIDLTVNSLNNTGFTATDFAIAVDAAYDYDKNGTALDTNLMIVDAQVPELLDAFTEDVNGNGKIDTVSFLFSERMNNMYRGVGGIAVIGYTVPAGTGTWESDIGTDDLFVVTITENGSACSFDDPSGCDTDATPNVTYIQGGEELEDFAGKHLGNFGPLASIDEAAPTIIGVEYAETDMIDFDVDTVIVYYSEDIALNEYDDADWTITPGSVDDLGATNETGATVVNGSEIHLTVDWTDDETGESGTEPALTYTANTGTSDSVTDGVEPTPAEDFGPVPMEDEMGPLIFEPNGGTTPYDKHQDENDTAVDTMDISENVDYSLSGVDAGLFSIDSSGNLTFDVAPDFENPTDSGTNNIYNVQVDSDDGNASIDMAFNITIDDVNEAPTDISIDSNNQDENLIGVVIGNFAATDEDSGETAGYSFSCTVPGVDDGNFYVNGNELKIYSAFDYEAKSSYSICMRTTDSGALTYDKNFTITVNDVNEAPTDISIDSNNQDENLTNIAIGHFSTTDEDAGDTAAYSLTCATPGVDDGNFGINGSDELRTAHPFDYETKSSYSICMRTTDSGGLTYDENFTITVNDVNEAPTIESDNSNDAEENQTFAQTVTSSDPDAGDTATYSIAGTNDDDHLFEIDPITGALDFLTAPNFETPADDNGDNDYFVTVVVTDSGSLTGELWVTITVTDVNEAPTDISIDSNNQDENLVSIAIGYFSTTDEDVGDTAAYSFTCTTPGIDDGGFYINGSDELRTHSAFDYETKNSYSICMRTTDSGGLTYDENFTITVNDVNDLPVIIVPGIGDSSSVNVDENQTAVTTVTATDEDLPAQVLGYSIIGGDDRIKFSINPMSGVLAFNTAPDFENPTDSDANNTYVVEVLVTDSGTLPETDSQVITVTVDNVTEDSLYRFWSKKNKAHFYTASEEERDYVIANYDDDVWKYEGVASDVFATQVPNSTAVYRFWSKKHKSHFYTASEAEKNYVIANYDDYIWKYEGIGYYAYPTEQLNTQPMYRFWSKKDKAHFYTASEEEKEYVIDNYDDYAWKYEGIAWYVGDDAA